MAAGRGEKLFWFTVMNLMALGLTAAAFFATLRGDVVDSMLRAFVLGLFEHEVLVTLLAGSPIFAALLVGFGYARRASRRRRRTPETASPLPLSSA